MKAEEFVRQIEAYYGPYPNDVVRLVVTREMAELGGRERDPVDLAQLARFVFQDFSSQYGKTPDVAAIINVADAHKAELSRFFIDSDDRVWRYGEQIGHYDESRFIPNEGTDIHGLPAPDRKLLEEHRPDRDEVQGLVKKLVDRTRV